MKQLRTFALLSASTLCINGVVGSEFPSKLEAVVTNTKTFRQTLNNPHHQAWDSLFNTDGSQDLPGMQDQLFSSFTPIDSNMSDIPHPPVSTGNMSKQDALKMKNDITKADDILNAIYWNGVDSPYTLEDIIVNKEKISQILENYDDHRLWEVIHQSRAFKYFPQLIEDIHQCEKADLVTAQHMLGILYQNGEGVKKNTDKGLLYIQIAASRGFALSQDQWGLMCYLGGIRGINLDREKAKSLFTLAADQGLVIAKRHLTDLYGVTATHENSPIYPSQSKNTSSSLTSSFVSAFSKKDPAAWEVQAMQERMERYKVQERAGQAIIDRERLSRQEREEQELQKAIALSLSMMEGNEDFTSSLSQSTKGREWNSTVGQQIALERAFSPDQKTVQVLTPLQEKQIGVYLEEEKEMEALNQAIESSLQRESYFKKMKEMLLPLQAKYLGETDLSHTHDEDQEMYAELNSLVEYWLTDLMLPLVEKFRGEMPQFICHHENKILDYSLATGIFSIGDKIVDTLSEKDQVIANKMLEILNTLGDITRKINTIINNIYRGSDRDGPEYIGEKKRYEGKEKLKEGDESITLTVSDTLKMDLDKFRQVEVFFIHLLGENLVK